MENEAQNPATHESGSGTSIEKFKTPEERDKAYLELEKLSYAQTQRLADMERKLTDLEVAATQRPQPEPDYRSFTDMYPSRKSPEQHETELASRILTKPSDVFREQEARLRREMMAEMQQALMTQAAVNRWQVENPHLAKHEELISAFVAKQPGNLPPYERLKRAGDEASKYIANLTQTNNKPGVKLDSAAYVESPSSGTSGQTAPVTAPSEEDDLTEMIRERAAIQAKKRL